MRYTVPGYTLILIVIGINYVPLLRLLKMTGLESAFGAFLALLSLFAGSALGFLVSQPYWWWFLRKGALFGVKEFRKTRNTLVEKYNLVAPPWNKDTQIEVYALFDYVDNTVEKGTEKLSELEARRWDMYHLLSITFHSSWIGLVTGTLCRMYCEYFFFEPFFAIPFPTLAKVLLENAESMTLLIIFACVISLLLLLFKSRQWIMAEYSAIKTARIRSSKVTENELKDAFPNLFLKTPND